MESLSSRTPLGTDATRLRGSQTPFKIDHTSLLSGRPASRQANSRSPNTESDSDRVGFIKGALGEKDSQSSSNGLGAAGYKPFDTGLKIDRTQSILSAAGYTSVGSSYRPVHRDPRLDRPQSAMSGKSAISGTSSAEIYLPKTGPRASLTPTALAKTTSIPETMLSSKNTTEERTLNQRGFRGSHTTLARAGSATPSGGLSTEALDDLENQIENRTQVARNSSTRQRTSSSSSSEEETEEAAPMNSHLPQRRTLRSPISSSDRSGNTTPYSSSSRTPAASPLPKSVLNDQSYPNRKYYTPVKAEIQQKDPEQAKTITNLKCSLELAQRKQTEDKKIMEELKKQIIKCNEEKSKEDPMLKGALENALREIRENKEVISSLNREINNCKKKNENLKEEIQSVNSNLQETSIDRSKEINNYRQRVMALEQENLILKKEKDNVTERLASISVSLASQESERMKDKEVLEVSIREMQEKVSHSQKDKLYAAIKTEDLEALKSLLLSPIDLDAVIAPDNTGRRAIHLAAENIRLSSFVNELIEAKVDVNAIDNDGESALHIAARSGRGRIVKALLEAKADWSILNIEGWSAVQVAAAVGNLSALEEFRKHDPAALKVKDPEGSTLLHYSCANKQKKATQWLVRQGSSKRRRDAYGLAAKDYKEAARGDEGLFACFGSGGNRMAQEQLPRLQLQTQDSIRRSRASSSRSLPSKALSETDQSSRATLSEKQFPVSTETDNESPKEMEVIEEENNAKSFSIKPVPLPREEVKTNSIAPPTHESLKVNLSMTSDSGRSTVSLDTSSLAAVPRGRKTPPPSAMPRVNVPCDESFSEDQGSEISMLSSQRSFKERLPTGLPNLGNSSFLNVVLQCLYYTKALSDEFIKSRYRDHINKKSDYRGDVAVAFGNVVKSLRAGKQTFSTVKNFKDIVACYDSAYVKEDTKDTHVFLQQLLQWLHADLSQDTLPDDRLTSGKVSFISTLFFGVQLTSIICQETGTELLKTEEVFSTLSLSVEMAGPVDLVDLLSIRYKPQLVLWSCGECGKDHLCLKKKKILKPPAHLIIHFERNEESNSTQNNLVYPYDNLSLANYLSEPHNDRGTYDLYAISNKSGDPVTLHHHTACCMTSNHPIWCLFNDLTVNPVTREEVTRQSDAQLLFYKVGLTSYQSTGV